MTSLPTEAPAAPPARRAVPFASTTRIVARGLGMTADALTSAFRPARLDDLPDIVALRQRGIDTRILWDDTAYLSWRYRLGRPGEGLGELWVVRDGADLLGMIGTQDCTLHTRERRYSGVQVMDVLVHPRVADAGLGIWMNQALFQRHEFVLAVGANANSHGIVTRLFTHQMARNAYAYPIDLGNYMARRLGSDLIGQPLGQAAGRMLGAWHALRRARLPAGVALRALTRFTAADVDSLNASGADPQDVRIEWSAERLNHRIFDNPRAPYAVTAAWRGDQCVGYVASRIVEREQAAPYVHLLDWRVPAHDGAAVFGGLLGGLIAQGRRHGCTTILTDLLHAAGERMLTEAGFRTGRPMPYKIVGLYTELPGLAQRAGEPGRWRITDIASDVDGL